MSDDYLSARPISNERRNSTVHFADDLTSPAHLAHRRSHNGSTENDAPAYAIASGVNRYPSQPSAYSSENGMSRQLSADIADQRADDMYQPHRRPSWQRGLSFDSIKQEKPFDEKRGSADRSEGSGNRRISLSRAASLDSVDLYYARRPPTLRYGNQEETPEGQSERGNSFLGRVNDAFHRAIRDPALSVTNARPNGSEDSRQNSFSEPRDKCFADNIDNFERTQCINEEFEDTYLMDEDGYEGLRNRRHPQERMGPPESVRSHSDYDPNTRKTYHQRRKKDRHTIKYHAESVEEYQKFILIFAKGLLTFGSPSHRVEAQLNSLSKIFEIEAQFQHTPGVIQVSFGNAEMKSSETCLIKSNVGLSLGNIHNVHNIYRAVLHDDMYASEGSYQIRKLLHAPPRYKLPIRFFLSYVTCMLICGIAFGGSLNDMWVAGIMGVITRGMQNIASKSDLSASGSEVFTAALVSFIARGFASFPTQIWCFSAISSASVISLLPGYLILSGTLDIAGKNQLLGAPKIVSGIMASLYLGFGLTLGSDVFLFIDRPARSALRAAAASQPGNTVISGFFQALNATDSGFSNTGSATISGTFTFQNSSAAAASQPHIIQSCYRDPSWGWYLQPLPYWTLFFLVPFFALASSMNNQQFWWSKQTAVMVSIACIAFWITRLCNLTLGLSMHPDYVGLIGSWLVGILGNGYSRRFGGTAFTAMLTGILLLIPDGLSAAGGLTDTYQAQGQDEYTQSLTLARKMISVIIGILSGVYSSAAVIYLFGKKKNAALVTF